MKPRKNETQSEFMQRCVPEMMGQNGGTKRPQDQAVAICIDIWKNPPKEVEVANTKSASVNGPGRSFADAQIAAGHVNKKDSWSFTAADGNALLGANGDDWTNYGRHHLGVDQSAPVNTKAHYKYPFAKSSTVYRSGLEAIRARAGQQKDDAVFAAAGNLITQIDGGKMLDKRLTSNHRAYSLLKIKSVSEDQRIIAGIATTPNPDRVGDIIEPMGVQYKNPIPLLWQHNTREPVGEAVMGKPTKDGITFEARIPKLDEPGVLKDRLDAAWQSVKIGLVKGVSIGFRGIEASFMDDGGIRFIESELLELSLVTIPANAEATIESIKAFDTASKDAALTTCPMGGDCPMMKAGTGDINYANCPKGKDCPMGEAKGATQPGATKTKPAAKTAAKETKHMMTILEQIAAFESKRATILARNDELMNKAADAGQTLDDAESKEYDDGAAEIAKIDEHLKRLHVLERTNREKAKPVQADTAVTGSESRGRISVLKTEVPKGTAFVRYCMAMAGARGNRWEALERAKQWCDQTPEVIAALGGDIPALMSDPAAIIAKAAVGTGTTTDATWASPLIAFQIMASEFIELLRPATIIGRIPNLRRVPFNIQMPRATAGSSMGWVGENAPKPVSNMAFDTVQLRWAKAAGIVILTDELVRFSNPAAEAIVRGDMIAAMAQFLDRQFVDPTVAAVTNVSPASITNGVTAVHRSGTNQAAFSADAQTLLTQFLNASLSTVGGVWIMSQRQALAFSLMLNALGQPFYPTINANGGTLIGYPVVASENVPSVGSSPADGTPIIFAVAPEIMLADDGQVVIDASNQASVNMDSAPDSPPTAATTLVSLWQMNMTGLRAERWINWLKRRSSAVQYIDNAAYA